MEEWRCIAEVCLDNTVQMIEHDHWRIIEAVRDGEGEEVTNELMAYIKERDRKHEEIDTLEENWRN